MSKIGRNDPCPCGSGKKYKQCCMAKAVEAVPQGFAMGTEVVALGDSPLEAGFDRRKIERTTAHMTHLLNSREWESVEEANAFLAGIMESGNPPSCEPETPLERAQERMYDAFAATGRRRVKLAREALEISPDCADA